MDRFPIGVGDFVHVYNRGVDKRAVFLDEEDYARFFFYLGILNHDKSKPSRAATGFTPFKTSPALTATINDAYKTQNPIISLCGLVEMPNHFHLLLREKRTGGISKYLQRVTTAYTMFFNEKHKRSGALFAGRFKSRTIDNERYLITVLHYIHNNPNELDGIRGRGLGKYFWSSLAAYTNKGSMRFVDTSAIDEVLGGIGDYKTLFGDYQEVSNEEDEELVDYLIDPVKVEP